MSVAADSSPGSDKNHSLADTLRVSPEWQAQPGCSWTSDPRDEEKINGYCFKLPGLW